ncbi:hypothetical protein [Streptomyces sp. NPDC001127]|uniref:hypothetical protein n=1 Tax=Streptomyces sp. NPDC001127 TaxID=3154377 RepID=UPI00331D0877
MLSYLQFVAMGVVSFLVVDYRQELVVQPGVSGVLSDAEGVHEGDVLVVDGVV